MTDINPLSIDIRVRRDPDSPMRTLDSRHPRDEAEALEEAARYASMPLGDKIPAEVAAVAEPGGTVLARWVDGEPAPEGTCAHCGEHVTLLGGSWTCDEGTIACLGNPNTSAAYAPHKPEGADR